MAYGPAFYQNGLYFLTNITGIPQLWHVNLPGDDGEPRWPHQLTFDMERVQEYYPSPLPDDPRVMLSRDAGGNENAQLFLLNTATADEINLSAGHDDAMHLPGDWSPDGQRFLFAANRRNKAIFDLYTLDIATGEAQMIWQHDATGYLLNPRFAPDGQRAVMMHAYASAAISLVEVDLASGTPRRITPEADDARFAMPRYALDGQSLYCVTDYEADHVYLAKIDLNSGDIERLATPDWDVEMCELAPDGRYLAYSINVEGTSQLVVLDLETGTHDQPAELGEVPGVLDSIAFSPDSRYVAFAYTAANRSADVYIWDWVQQALKRVTASSHAGLSPERFVIPELIHYPTFDDAAEDRRRTIPAWLYRPESEDDPSPAPVVVIVHGGPESQARPSFNFLAQYLAHNGYAVLLPNVRGSTGYGKAFSHLDDVEKRMDSVADLAHAAHWLKAQAEFDSDRIVVYGGSYGGFMVLAAMTHYPDLWAAGVDIVGISSLVTFLENTSEYRRAHRESEYGSLERDRAFLESIAPINHIDKIAAPLMIIHGANDPRVPVSEAEQVAAALEAHDITVRKLIFDDEGHGVVRLKNKLVMYPEVVAFLDDVL